jgi:hypothetical protein
MTVSIKKIIPFLYSFMQRSGFGVWKLGELNMEALYVWLRGIESEWKNRICMKNSWYPINFSECDT